MSGQTMLVTVFGNFGVLSRQGSFCTLLSSHLSCVPGKKTECSL